MKGKPNEAMQKRYADQFDFSKTTLNQNEEETKASTTDAQQNKPKYDKTVDFFDNITNSTLEEKQ